MPDEPFCRTCGLLRDDLPDVYKGNYVRCGWARETPLPKVIQGLVAGLDAQTGSWIRRASLEDDNTPCPTWAPF